VSRLCFLKMAENDENTPVRSPARVIVPNEEFESEAALFSSVCDVAYLRKKRGDDEGIQMQFDVKKDPTHRSSSSISYICSPTCQWRITAGITRAQGKEGQCTVKLVNDKHSDDCIGSMPQPSRKWFLSNVTLRNVALHAKDNNALIAQATAMGLHMSRQTATDMRSKVKEEVGTASGASYKLIEPWLQKFCELNPGAQYEFKRDPQTGQFEHAFLMLPCWEIITNSFLGTIATDCGFSVDPANYKQVSTTHLSYSISVYRVILTCVCVCFHSFIHHYRHIMHFLCLCQSTINSLYISSFCSVLSLTCFSYLSLSIRQCTS